MQATFVNSYRKAETGNVVYVYAITGDSAAYVKSVEESGRSVTFDEKKRPLFFTTNFATASGEFRQSKQGNWYVDSSGVKRALDLAKNAGIDASDLIMRLAGLQPKPADNQGIDTL